MATYNGTGTGSFYAIKNTMDKFGNLIISGRTGFDYITLKYDNSGNLMWSRIYDGGVGSDDAPRDMTVDDSGYVYVTGYSYEGTSNGGVNWLTIKYSKDGELIWKRSLDWTGHKSDDPNSLALDKNYNVYVTGYGFVGPPPLLKEDLVLAKYDINGEFQWAESLSSSSTASSVGYSVLTDDSNNVIVSGYTGNRVAVAKYDGMGNIIWNREFFRNSGNLVSPLYSKLDYENNIILTGFYSVASQSNFVTLKYDRNGNLLWSRIFDSPVGTLDIANDICLDQNNNIFITGRTFTNFYNDIFVLKYSSSGDTLWLRTFDAGYAFDDEAKSIKSDSLGNTYLTGNIQTPTASNDIITLKYDLSGNLVWQKIYSTSSNPTGQDFGITISLDNFFNVYVSGSCVLSSGYYGITSIKYSQLTNANINSIPSQSEYKLYQNYPNPFNPYTIIGYEMPVQGNVQIEVYNINGSKVQTLVNEKKESGNHEIEFNGSKLSSGIYFYKFSINGKLINTKKLILLK